jgi:hypothetical protein
MIRVSILAVVLAACGNKAKGPELAPLPPDNPVAETKPDAAVEEPPEVPVRPVPIGPLQVTLPGPTFTVKLVNGGKGKKTPLKLSAKAGGKQEIELALDFGITQSADVPNAEGKLERQSQADIVPTVVLGGNAEVAAVEPDGRATYALTITKTDARAVANSQVPVDKFRPILESVIGLKLSGSVGANGATGDTKLDLEKQAEASAQVIELVGLTLPPWPPLPAEPIGEGAKWTATRALKLAGRLDVTQTTDYQLVSYKNGTWTIKGTTKITGADQTMQGGKITKITGTGTTEVTLVDGALFPTHKSVLAATFTASEPDPKPDTKVAKLDFLVNIGSAVTAK